jgi:acetoin utilization protein AcuC
MEALRIIWDDAYSVYDFGAGHPMSPLRLELTAGLIRDLGLLAHAGVSAHRADPAGDAVLATVHDEDYIEAVKAASAGRFRPGGEHGLGTDDVPVFAGMHEAAARIVGATVDVVGAVWRGKALHGVNLTGGMHHAMPDRASGFCVYNDVAVAIETLLGEGAERVCYVDVDVHHGDGVERIFWDDPRVLTISLHETGSVLFPGTGGCEDIGGPRALGTAVNVPFPPGTSDAGWLRGFHAVVPPLVRAFGPQILLTQHGCDTHLRDPLAHLALSLDCQVESYRVLHDLSHETCEGRWAAVGGGGYDLACVVPRAWAHLVGIAAHHPVPSSAPLPATWRHDVMARLGEYPPLLMTDGRTPAYVPWRTGYDGEDAVDRAVLSTRQAVFPLHGLDPWSG